MQCGKTALLFDRLVGAGEQRRRVKRKRLGGLEVDRQFELGRRLHRKVGRLLAFKDAIDVASSAPELVDEIRPVGHQAAAGCEETVWIDRRQLVPARQRNDEDRKSTRLNSSHLGISYA